jgi:hypothetical protein
MKRIFLFMFISIFYSCSHGLLQQKSNAPSWVEGIRSGEESLRIVNGNRVLYRRILSQQKEHPDETCSNVLKMVQGDLSNESVEGISIPYNLEYLYFDPQYKLCAVTISVGSDLITRIGEIKSLRKSFDSEKEAINKKFELEMDQRKKLEIQIRGLQAFIEKNNHLLERYSDLNNKVEIVRRSIAGEREKVRNGFYTGMNRNQFKEITGSVPKISMHGIDLCYRNFNTFKSSPHGNIHVCWNGGYGSEALSGICDIRSGDCFTRDP